MTICPVCKSENVKKTFSSFDTHGREMIDINEKFDVFACDKCGNIFLNIAADKEYYAKYYKEDYYDSNTDGLLGSITKMLRNFSFRRKQEFISSKFPENKKIKLIDVGCGAGEFLESLDEKRFDIFGLEVSAVGNEICQKKHLRVYREDILTKDFGEEKFDVVTLWHVLEHISSPTELFAKVYKILNKDGLLIFQVPNSDSLGFRLGKELWFHLDSPRHLWIPNKKSVYFLSNKGGFEVSEIKNEFYDYPLDLFWSIRKSKLRFLIFPLYPFFKIFSTEHLTFILKRK